MNSSAREKFAQLLRLRDERQTMAKALVAEANATFDERSREEFARLVGKRKQFSRSAFHAVAPAKYDELFAQVKAELDAKAKAASLDDAAMKQLAEELNVLAATAEIRPGAEFREWRQVWESSYATQGFGSYRYAENAANVELLNAQYAGVETRVEITTVKFDVYRHFQPSSTSTFHIQVKVESEIDLEILSRRERAPLRAIVKMLMQKGSNPRVLYPFLPYDYEQKEGLDHFGNDLKAA